MNIIEVKDIYKTFTLNLKKTEVLKWVNLSIKKWEVFGFLWPNGAGKTTTMKTILDFIKPTKWEVFIFWEKLEKHRENLSKIGYAPEQAYYYEHLTGEEFLYFTWKLSWLKKSELKDLIPIYLKKLWLDFAWKRYIKTYSKWMKQRLWLASCILHSPELVFFDEPMSWLDPLWRNLVKNIMLELKENWTTVFFNTHILSDVEDVADSFAIINKWKIIYNWDIKDVNISLEQFFVDKIKENDNEIEIK